MGDPLVWSQFTKLFDENLRDVRDEETRYSDLKSMISKLYNVINSDRAEEQFYEVGSVPDIPVFNGRISTLSVYPGYYQKIEPKEFAGAVQIQRKLIDDKKFSVLSNMGRGLMKAGNRTKEKYAVRPFANATSVAFDFMTSEEGKSLASTTHTKHRPLLIVDLAVPRDVENEVADLDDVFLYTVDDLGRIAREGLDQRESAVVQAEAIIETQVSDFMHWLDNRELVPMIRSLRDEGERARRHAVVRALKHLGRGEDPRQVIDFLSHSLTNKLLHPPTHALSHASTEDREEVAQWLARLYRLPPQQ